MISACEELGDLRRAAEWTDATLRWSEAPPAGDVAGHLPGAPRRAAPAAGRLDRRRARGPAGLRRARRLPRAATWPRATSRSARSAAGSATSTAPRRRSRTAEELCGQQSAGLALVRLAQRRIDAATAIITRMLAEQTWNRLARGRAAAGPRRRSRSRPATSTPRRRRSTSSSDIAAEYESPALAAAALSARGRLQLGQGDASAACATLREALRAVAGARGPLRGGHGSPAARPGVPRAAATRRARPARSPARRDLRPARRRDRRRASAPRPAVGLPAGLTDREAEVLGLVASGQHQQGDRRRRSTSASAPSPATSRTSSPRSASRSPHRRRRVRLRARPRRWSLTATTRRCGGRVLCACPRASPARGRPGSPRPSSTSSAGSCCGAGICSAHGSRSPSRSSAVWTVKSAGVDVVEVVPVDRERHGRTGPDPRAVARDDGRAAHPGRVDEHLALAVLLHERGGRDRRVEPARPGRRSPGWPRRPAPWSVWSSMGTNTWRPFAPLVLTAPSKPDIGQGLAHEPGGGRRPPRTRRPRAGRGRGRGGSCGRAAPRAPAPGGTRRPAGWRTTAGCAGRCRGRRPPRAWTPPPTAHGGHPLGRVLRDVLLHERLLAAVDADHRQRPVLEHRQDPVAAPRRGSRPGPAWSRRPLEQRLVEVGEGHALALVVSLRRGHASRPRSLGDDLARLHHWRDGRVVGDVHEDRPRAL